VKASHSCDGTSVFLILVFGAGVKLLRYSGYISLGEIQWCVDFMEAFRSYNS
jgi:hypothetical protein